MRRTRVVAVVALATGSVVVAVIGASQVLAAPPTSITEIHQSDLAPTLSDTRTSGHWEFLEEGLHIWTDDTTGQAKSAEYFPLMLPLSDVSSYDYEWFGSTPPISQQFFIDTDGVLSTREGILVGEKTYAPGDVWLTNNSSDAMKLAAPSCDGDPALLTMPASHCSGAGSYFHGTLAEWATAFPTATVTYGGYALGSGIKGDGVLRSLTYGPSQFVFAEPAPPPATQTVTLPGPTTTATATATVTAPGPTMTATVTVTPEPVVVDVTGSADLTRVSRRVTIEMTSADQPPGAVAGAPLVWTIKVDRKTVNRVEQGFGQRSVWAKAFGRNHGTHTVRLYKNGTLVRSVTVDTDS